MMVHPHMWGAQGPSACRLGEYKYEALGGSLQYKKARKAFPIPISDRRSTLSLTRFGPSDWNLRLSLKLSLELSPRLNSTLNVESLAESKTSDDSSSSTSSKQNAVRWMIKVFLEGRGSSLIGQYPYPHVAVNPSDGAEYQVVKNIHAPLV